MEVLLRIVMNLNFISNTATTTNAYTVSTNTKNLFSKALLNCSEY